MIAVRSNDQPPATGLTLVHPHVEPTSDIMTEWTRALIDTFDLRLPNMGMREIYRTVLHPEAKSLMIMF